MRFLRHSLAGLSLIAITAGLLVWAGSLLRDSITERMTREVRQRPTRERVIAVEIVTAEARTETPLLRVFGEVQSQRSLDLRAPRAGRIVALGAGVVEGGRVAAGDLIVQIDPTAAQAARDNAASDLSDAELEARDAGRALALAQDEEAAARAQQELRGRALTRQQDLSARGVGTASAVEAAELAAAAAEQAVLTRRQAVIQAQARAEQSKSRIARARIALSEAERALAETRLTAPYPGRLADVSAREGKLAGQNEQLARLIDDTALEVSAQLSTAQYARLLDEQGALRPLPAIARLDLFGADLTASGRLARDGAAVAQGETGRRVFAALDVAAGLKPGDLVTLEIAEPPLADVVRLPAPALGADGRVLALDSEDRLEAIEVVLLRRQGNEVLVGAGPIVGRRIVAARTPLLGQGIKVRPLDTRAGPPAAPETIALTEERRARLIAFVEGNRRMPEAVRARLLAQLAAPEVPAATIARLEERM